MQELETGKFLLKNFTINIDGLRSSFSFSMKSMKYP